MKKKLSLAAVFLLLAAMIIIVHIRADSSSEIDTVSGSAVSTGAAATDAPFSAAPTESPAPTPLPSPEPTPAPTPVPIAGQLDVHVNGRYGSFDALTDGSYVTTVSFAEGDTISVSSAEPMRSIYIQWDIIPTEWTLQCGEDISIHGTEGFIHEYIALHHPCEEITITLHHDYEPTIAEIYAFGDGARPDWVQEWNPPCERADMLLFPTHSDDEFVFFGGVIPWAIDRGYLVQVAYIVKHMTYRRHEMLDSLWEAGITNYPVTSEVGDFYFDTIEEARDFYGTDRFTEYITAQIRRFRPLVVVGHDENGDSGHPVHIFGVECLKYALDAAADPARYPESYDRYGVWDVPKTYLHVYGDPEKMTVLDYETPLEQFGGRTAFEVACDAFSLCVSQYRNGNGKYRVYGSDSIHDTHLWGLYRTLVGPDLLKNDFFENITAEDYCS